MQQDELYKRAFREIYYYAIEGLDNLAGGWGISDVSLQISELFVADADKKWVRDYKMEPVPMEQWGDPQKGFLEICRVCYPDPNEENDLRVILRHVRNVSGSFLTDEEKADSYEPITLEGFIFLAGFKRERLKAFGLSETAIERELSFWESRLGQI